MFEKITEFLGFQVHCVRFLWEFTTFGGNLSSLYVGCCKTSRNFAGFSWIFEKILEDLLGFRVHCVRFSWESMAFLGESVKFICWMLQNIPGI